MLLSCDPTLEKVFGIGLSRTGTTSLHAALRQLGYRTVHWREPYTGMLAGPLQFFFFDAASDITVSAQFETLAYAFPNAKFIYTTRDIEAWKASIRWHYDAEEPPVVARRLRQFPVTKAAADCPPYEVGADFHWVHASLYTAHATWEAAYEAHDERVSKFFETQPCRLLTVDLTEGRDNWKHVCSFLERSIPKAAFPKRTWKRPEGARASGVPLPG